MRVNLTIAAAPVLFGMAGDPSAEVANQDHASHNHPVSPSPPRPMTTIALAVPPDAQGGWRAMRGSAAMSETWASSMA